MRKFFIGLALTVFALASCTKDDECFKNGVNPLVGRWNMDTYMLWLETADSELIKKNIGSYWAFRNDGTGYFLDYEYKEYQTFTYEYVEDYRTTNVVIIGPKPSKTKSWVELHFEHYNETNWCKVEGDTLYFYNSNGTGNGKWARTNETIGINGYTKR